MKSWTKIYIQKREFLEVTNSFNCFIFYKIRIFCILNLEFLYTVWKFLDFKTEVSVDVISLGFKEGSRGFCVACAAGAGSGFWCSSGLHGVLFSPFTYLGTEFIGSLDLGPSDRVISGFLYGYCPSLSVVQKILSLINCTHRWRRACLDRSSCTEPRWTHGLEDLLNQTYCKNQGEISTQMSL